MEDNVKKERVSMSKDIVPDDFTLGLAIVDALPVLFFGASIIAIALMFQSPLFFIGALVVFLAGAIKVLWKIIVVIKKKNVWWMFVQMRIFMPIGMIIMIVSLIVNRRAIDGAAVWQAVTSMPALVFFVIGFAGMVLMTVFAIKLDSSDSKSNWIEQIVNTVAQLSFFVGILLLI